MAIPHCGTVVLGSKETWIIRMHTDKNLQVFFELLRAGLWEQEAQLAEYKDIDYSVIMRKAEEQSVVGLITAGLEQVKDVKVPQEWSLQFIGSTLQIEQRNNAMNKFVAKLIEELRKNNIYALLVKGQGIAQCYEKPLWRSSGDVDLLLEGEHYLRAAIFLKTIANAVDEERPEIKHFAFSIGQWEVELHGTLRSQLGKRIDDEIEDIQKFIFGCSIFRVWKNEDVDIVLPAPDEDIVFVFCHILQHFFHEGIGFRQICDWCRLIWTYHSSINYDLLGKRLKRMGLMNEWHSFATLAVDLLGMPQEAMPFYSSSNKWKRKALKISLYILETGNFGHNLDKSYYSKYPFIIYKCISFWMHTKKGLKHFILFPDIAIREWKRMIVNGIRLVARGV